MNLTPFRRRAASAAAVITVPAVIAVLALVNPGFPLARVDLNDGGVWLTATSSLQLGRFNAQVEELNAGLVAAGTTFDVLQDAGDVLLVEPGTVSVVDPASVTLTTRATVPTGSVARMGAGTVAILGPDGSAWVRAVPDLGGLRAGSDAPELVLGVGGTLAVSRNGVALGVAGGTGDATRVDLVGGQPRLEKLGTLGAGVEQLTTVGDEPVGLAGSTLRTLRGSVELDGAGLVLQQPGPRADRVLVSSTTALLEVPLDGGPVVEHRTTGSGKPAAPVALDGCIHAAWATGTGSYLRVCDGGAPEVIDLEGMTSADALTFRVNRHVVVLNDTLRGRMWMPQQDSSLRKPNWSDFIPDPKPADQPNDASGSTTTQDLVTECSSQAASPTATDDTFGVRRGRTTILPVIDNDSSSDCGILAISEFDQIPAQFGHLESIYGGRALQLTVADGATGTVSFVYTISDGRGTSAPSTARVQLTVHEPASNAAPVQVRIGALKVELGGRADYSALADFVDPDGDDLVLVGASAETGTVRFRQDGTVTYLASGGALGRTTVHLVVSDGTETSEGTIEVDVRAVGSLAPRIDPVHAVTYVGLSVLVQPLLAVRSSSDEPVRLAGVDEVAGTSIVPDLTTGTFTFSASRPGTYYVPFTVAAPPQQASGLARIDVREWPSEVQAPVAVRDRAYLPAGGEVTIDPLANDVDLAGGVLVLQSVEAPPDAGLRLAVLGHQLVQITSVRTLTGPVTVRYVVSNGTAQAVGEIAVYPVPPTATQQAPVVANVEVSVRTGGVVTIPVLDTAYDPDGDHLTLDPVLAEPLGEGQGLLFVSGDVLRYQAPSTALTAHATFNVKDSAENATAATVTVHVHASDAATKAPPRPRDLTARAFEGDTIRIPVPVVGIDDDGDGVTLLGAAAAPKRGRIVDVGADYLEYQALPGETGTDTFTYAVEDWVGQRAVATVRVGISPRPTAVAQVVARNDDVTVRPGQLVEVRVLANDVDSSGGVLSLAPELEMAAGTDAHVEGRRIIVQAPSTPGILQIAYTATNARGGRDTGILTVTVVDDVKVLAPIAKDVVVPPIDTLGRQSVEVDVLAVAQNPSGPLSDLAVSVPSSASGVATVTPAGRVVVTLIDHAQTVPYLLTNTDRRANGVSTYAFISVPALGFFPPTNRPKAPELRVASGQPLVIRLDEQVQVAPGRTATVADPTAVTATKADGSALVRDVSTLLFTSAPGYAGPASITVPVTDRTGTGDTTGRTSLLTLPITVYAVDDHPPTFGPAVVDLAPGEAAVSVDLHAFTAGPQGATASTEYYSYRLTSAVPAGFTATLTGSVLVVSAARTTAKGTVGPLLLTLGYGLAGSMDAEVDLHVIASTRPTARVVDRTVTDGVQGRDAVVDVLAGAFNPFPDSPLTVVSATVETPGAGVATSTSSTVTVRPDAMFVGQMVTRFRVADSTGDPAREVEGRITVVVRGRPDTPKAPKVVESRDSTVVLAWDAPDNRGEPITGYRVTAISAGGQIVRACVSTTCTIDNLINDTEYTFTVAAQNAVDWSDPSPASAPARPDAVPDAPAAPSLTFGDQAITATWSTPTSAGSPVQRYDVEITPAPRTGPATISTASTTATFGALDNGTAYTVRVRAYNRLTTAGAWSASSAAMRPAGVPGAPVVTAQRVEDPLGGQLTVTWTAPSGNGDDGLKYDLVISGGPGAGPVALSDPAATSYAFRGAANGVAYTFAVRAANKAGTGAVGTFQSSTYGIPGAVSGVTASGSGTAATGGGTVQLDWAAADANGSAVIAYRLRATGGTESELGVGTSHLVEGLVGGLPQTYQVQACNVAGCGAWSAVATATPLTLPGEPSSPGYDVTGWVARNRPSQLTASWTAPALPGGGANLRYELRLRLNGTTQVDWYGVGTSTSVDIALDAGWVARGGTDVEVDVRAVTGVGRSSEMGVPVTHTLRWGSAPGAMAAPTLAAAPPTGTSQVTARWVAPDDGGAPISAYSVVWSIAGVNQPERTLTGATLTDVLTIDPALIPAGGEEITVTLKAVNDLGTGPPTSSALRISPPPPPVTP
ncbi:MAG: Ig-like domain-containing protein [Cellulomonas sp.]